MLPRFKYPLLLHLLHPARIWRTRRLCPKPCNATRFLPCLLPASYPRSRDCQRAAQVGGGRRNCGGFWSQRVRRAPRFAEVEGSEGANAEEWRVDRLQNQWLEPTSEPTSFLSSDPGQTSPGTCSCRHWQPGPNAGRKSPRGLDWTLLSN